MSYADHFVYASYMDESFDMRQAGLFAVGGLIAKGPAIFDLESKWERLLRRSDIDIEYYKASECELGTGQFKKFVKRERFPTPEEKRILHEISCEFIRLITSEFVVGHGINVVQDDFYEVTKDPAAKAVLGDTPYKLAYDLAMVQCAWIMKDLERKTAAAIQPWNRVPRPHVSFVCDEHETHSPSASVAYLKLKEGNPEAAQYMASYSYADEKLFPVLQAADAMVYEVRRSAKLSLGIRTGEWREQFRILDRCKRIGLIQIANRESLQNVVNNHKPGEPFNLSAIMEQVFHADIKFNLYGSL
ncbi:MAG: hypothetical protein WCE61_18710 [Candidatus Acidiferrum sp.]